MVLLSPSFLYIWYASMKNTGILLIAIGNRYYGQMALTLATSIKMADSSISIALITDEQSLSPLSETDKTIFDQLIEANEKQYIENGTVNPFKLKTFLYDLTPFKNTLYLDVDAICMNGYTDLGKLFDQLKDIDFQMYEVKRYSKENANTSNTVWTKGRNGQELQKLWDLYKFDNDALYPEYNSSFVWFKKTKENKQYFDRVKKNYAIKKLLHQKIGRHYPDELAFGTASAQLKHYSHIEGFRPIYFSWTVNFTEFTQMGKEYWFVGFAGGSQVSKMVRKYDALAKANSVKSGYTYFPFDAKKKVYWEK